MTPNPYLMSRVLLAAVAGLVASVWSLRELLSPVLTNSATLGGAVVGAAVRWAAAEAALVLALVLAICVNLAIVRELLAPMTETARCNWLVGIGVAALLVCVLFFYNSFSLGTTERYVEAIIKGTCVQVTWATRVTDALVELGGVTLLACCYLLSTKVFNASEVQVLASRIKWTLLALYSAAAALAIGLLEIHALFAWSATLDKSVAGAPAGLASAAGLLFSLLLAATFGPVLLQQHFWLDAATRERLESHPDSDVAKWLSANGLKTSPLILVVGVLTPLFTGAIAGVFKGAP